MPGRLTANMNSQEARQALLKTFAADIKGEEKVVVLPDVDWVTVDGQHRTSPVYGLLAK